MDDNANGYIPKLHPNAIAIADGSAANAYLYSDHYGNIYVSYVDTDGRVRNVHLDNYPRHLPQRNTH